MLEGAALSHSSTAFNRLSLNDKISKLYNSCMTVVTLFLLVISLFSFSPLWARGSTHLRIREPGTNATCLSQYSWMNNAEGNSPCLAVAYVVAACVGDTWVQPALPPGYSYNLPNGTMITPCYCSWSCYNLMMACTVCQNTSYIGEIKTWPAFSENCPSSYTDEMFPQGYVIWDNHSIPYWATIDPTSWQSQLFSTNQAEIYANESKPDVYPSTSSSSSSSSSSGSSLNIGAIIGGTVGGAAGVLLILIGCIFLYKRRQSRQQTNTNDVVPFPQTGTPLMNTHARWASTDSSAIFSQTLSSPSMSYLTMQPHGMGTQQPTVCSTYPASSPPPETSSFLTTENPVSHRAQIPMV